MSKTLGTPQYLLITWMDEAHMPEMDEAECFGPFTSKDEAEDYYLEHFDSDIKYKIATLYPIIES